MINYKYANIQNFGNSKSMPCAGKNHPLTMCMSDTMDKQFLNGGIGALYGPRSQPCQAYMAERCANEWDGFCEYFYREHGPGGTWPNNQEWPNLQPRYWEVRYGLNQNLTTGEQLLRNTAERKYCTYENCKAHCEPFNPLDPDSPSITFYRDANGNNSSCIPICNVNPATIDSDPVMDRMLKNPRAAAGTIINICNTAQRTGTDLSGTKLGKVCETYQQIMKN